MADIVQANMDDQCSYIHAYEKDIVQQLTPLLATAPNEIENTDWSSRELQESVTAFCWEQEIIMRTI